MRKLELPVTELEKDLGKIISVTLNSPDKKFPINELVPFSLVITNKTDRVQRIQFSNVALLGMSPKKGIHFYRVYKGNDTEYIYEQPYIYDEFRSELVEDIRVLELEPRAAFKQEFTWNPKNKELSFFKKHFFREKGTYRIEVNMLFHAAYMKYTPDWETINTAKFYFERN
ncbi:MAG: hypothetical protein GY754_32880 [bacterium]|nr:hypothetical protein [bacterium]